MTIQRLTYTGGTESIAPGASTRGWPNDAGVTDPVSLLEMRDRPLAPGAPPQSSPRGPGPVRRVSQTSDAQTSRDGPSPATPGGG